jgi:hypothetical protein
MKVLKHLLPVYLLIHSCLAIGDPWSHAGTTGSGRYKAAANGPSAEENDRLCTEVKAILGESVVKKILSSHPTGFSTRPPAVVRPMTEHEREIFYSIPNFGSYTGFSRNVIPHIEKCNELSLEAWFKKCNERFPLPGMSPAQSAFLQGSLIWKDYKEKRRSEKDPVTESDLTSLHQFQIDFSKLVHDRADCKNLDTPSQEAMDFTAKHFLNCVRNSEPAFSLCQYCSERDCRAAKEWLIFNVPGEVF